MWELNQTAMVGMQEFLIDVAISWNRGCDRLLKDPAKLKGRTFRKNKGHACYKTKRFLLATILVSIWLWSGRPNTREVLSTEPMQLL
jgi:hypothetical protein